MDVMVRIPDELANRLGADIERHVLEVLAVDEFKQGRLTKPELRQLLGFETRYELDGFLKAHGVYEAYTLADFEREREALKELGL